MLYSSTVYTVMLLAFTAVVATHLSTNHYLQVSPRVVLSSTVKHLRFVASKTVKETELGKIRCVTVPGSPNNNSSFRFIALSVSNYYSEYTNS